MTTSVSDYVLRTLLEGIDDAVFSVDTEYRYTAFNSAHARAMKELYGSTIAVGMPAPEAMTQWDDRQAIISSLDRALAGERHVKHIFAGDSALARRYYEITDDPVIDLAGTIVGVLVWTRDMSRSVEVAEMERYEYERVHLVNALTSRTEASAEQTVQTGLELLVTMTGSKLGFFDAFDEASASFTPLAWSKGVKESGATPDHASTFSLESSGCWAEVIRQRAPVIENDFAPADAGTDAFPESHAKLARWVAVPVFNAGRIVAVAAVADKDSPYAPQDTSSLFSAANSVWTIAELRRSEELRRLAG